MNSEDSNFVLNMKRTQDSVISFAETKPAEEM